MVVLACFVGLTTCLLTDLEFLEFVVWEIEVDFGLPLYTVGLEVTTLTEFVLGLGRVALDGVTLGLGDGFLAVVGCVFLGSAPCSNRAETGFILEGFGVVVAGLVGFFLLFVAANAFLGLLRGVGFGGVGLGLEGL